MARTYRATGINLKGMALGENDRLLTILTKEHGLVKAVAAGARKHRSNMTGRSNLFVVNDLLISSGRSLDRISQAETLQSFIGLGQNLAKLTAAQYLAELALIQALTDQPQEELFLILTEHLSRLQQINSTQEVLACLSHGIYHLLVIAGFAPQVYTCCHTHQSILPNLSDPKWQVGFSVPSGGLVNLSEPLTIENARVSHHLTASQLVALQYLPQTELPAPALEIKKTTWLVIERLLRACAQYHFDKTIQSADLIDSCFNL